MMKRITITLMFLLVAYGISSSLVSANNYADAPELSIDDEWSENIVITSSEEVYWFKIVIPSDGLLNLKIMDLGGESGGLEWTIKDKDFVSNYYTGSIYSGSETSPVSELKELPMSSGTYYLSFSPYNGSGRTFRIASSLVSYDTNDESAVSFDSCQTYNIGTEITAALTNMDEEDWFSFTVDKDDNYNFVLYTSWTEGGLEWHIKNSDLTEEIDYGSAYGGDLSSPIAWTEEVSLAPGTYYLYTSKYNGDGGKYSFSITSKSDSSPVEANVAAPSGESDDNKELYCYNCGKPLKDDYSFCPFCGSVVNE